MDSRAHDQLSNAAFEALDEAFVGMSAVRDGKGCIADFQFEFCNRAALTMLRQGRTEVDVVGRRLLDLTPTYASHGLFDTYVRVTETGEPFRGDFAFDDDGTQGEFEISANKFGDGVVLLAHDIAARKRDERQLRMLAEQLQGALTSRVVIEQAKGFLAAKYQTDPTTAFAALRRYARNHNRRVHDVAAAIITGRLTLVPGDN